MANTRELRRRIRSIKNTSQITRAMQMVAATKMRKAQSQALSGRPYNSILSRVLGMIKAGSLDLTHSLMQANDSPKAAVLLLTTDKGLCGALNTNMARLLFASQLTNGNRDLAYYTIGKKGRDFVVRTGRTLEADFEVSEHMDWAFAVRLRKFFTNLFLSGEAGEVYLAYPDFISILKQEPRLVRLLPVEKGELPEGETARQNFLFEPNMAQILDYALTHFIDTKIYQALLELKASEHSARMVAMKNATDNAKELVDDLTLSYNQLRQDIITRELLEITSASAALEVA